MHKLSHIFQTRIFRNISSLIFITIVPLLIAFYFLDLQQWDLSIPLVYSKHDDIWQLVLTKALRDTGWVLTNPFLGAPGIAHWHYHAAAQTSALHSIIMLGLSYFIDDAVKIQQVYYLLNFPLITLTSYVACRILGISKLSAVVIGILFSFTTYRINHMFYAFLSNYFVIPLALVPVVWIMMGEFSEFSSDKLREQRRFNEIKNLLLSRKFFFGFLVIVLVALTDGYYAFFTLLLLGYATIIGAISGDVRRRLSLLVPAIYILVLISVALALSWPLFDYKHSHPEEFFPNGARDPALFKHPFEAEVYSSSLKLLLAPITNHRVSWLADFGRRIINTSDAARKYPIIKPIVSLGSLGTFFFVCALTLLAVPVFRRTIRAATPKMPPNGNLMDNRLLWVVTSLTFFVFLCSISGGIGTLIALAYPTIRAYDRFPIFLIFILFLGAGSVATTALKSAGGLKRWLYRSLIIIVAVIGIYDQVPRDAAKGNLAVRTRFLAERNFVRAMETSLPAGAMVYQYPYSQYLADNKYYGHGAFSHIRLYLHSFGLRWSNGASQNSPVENWHLRVSRLPIEQLLSEVQGVGFKGFVVDRTVVPDAEYVNVRQALIKQTGAIPIEDEASKLAFWKLDDVGYSLVYDQNYKEVERLTISDKSRLTQVKLPPLVNTMALERVLAENDDKNSIVLEKVMYPDVFFEAQKLDRGLGDRAIEPITDMKGDFVCALESSQGVTAVRSDTLVLTITNRSDFDWTLGEGRYPLRIGAHIFTPDGTLLRFDDGFRVPAEIFIAKNSSAKIRFPLDGLSLKGTGSWQEIIAEFALVQDGNAWFEMLSCKVTIRK